MDICDTCKKEINMENDDILEGMTDKGNLNGRTEDWINSVIGSTCSTCSKCIIDETVKEMMDDVCKLRKLRRVMK